MKKIISLILSVVIVLCTGLTAYADNGAVYSITDCAFLVHQSAETAADILAADHIDGLSESDEAVLKNYLAEQYSDSELQEKYINLDEMSVDEHSITFCTVREVGSETEKNGAPTISAERERITIYRSYTTNKTDSWGKYDIACTVTANITVYPIDWLTTEITLNNVKFRYHKAGTYTQYVSSADLVISGDPDDGTGSHYQHYTYYGPSADTDYYLYSTDSRHYTIGGSYFEYLDCGAIVTLSDGSSSGDTGLYIDCLS